MIATMLTVPLPGPPEAAERQLTHATHGHILTNTGVGSPDGNWLVYDTRSDAAGEVFDGERIEMVNVASGHVRLLYQARNGAHCGVATWNPRQMRIVFILGPEHPAADWQYGPSHRQGVIVDVAEPGLAQNLDAQDLTSPLTLGALRGGSHLHVWEAAGQWLSFTYNDALLESELRDVAVAIPSRPMVVPKTHPRNRDGNYFCAVVTRTTAKPKPGSDEICRACEEAWLGANGYVRLDGSRQRHALAYQGTVATAQGKPIAEVFIADLPEDLRQPGEEPQAGAAQHRPSPPKGVTQRRLTFTAERKFPGLQGPRHWLRSSADGSRIAFLMRDDSGIVQLWTISPNGGPPIQLTRNAQDIASAFTWSPDGKFIAHVMDSSVCVTDTASGKTTRLTPRRDDLGAPRPEACVFSPNGEEISYVRRVPEEGRLFNQIFIVNAKRNASERGESPAK